MSHEDLLATIETFKRLLGPTISPEAPAPYPERFLEQMKLILRWMVEVLELNFEAPGVEPLLFKFINWVSDKDPHPLDVAMLQAGCLFALELYELDIRRAMQEEGDLLEQPE